MKSRERATRASWKIDAVAKRTTSVPVAIRCTADEFERLRYGYVPQAMEEHWFVHVVGTTVYFHRSWTGLWYASVSFERQDRAWVANVALVNAKYAAPDAAEDAKRIEEYIQAIIDMNEGWEKWSGRSGWIDARPALRDLIDQGSIQMAWSDALARSPDPLPSNTAFDRVAGMLLGLATGDALGNPSEGSLSRSTQGEITGYQPNPHAGGRSVGTPSDDTQLAFWTLEQLIADGGLDPERVARRLSCQRIYGIGRTVREFIANRKRGRSWDQAGVASAGNGALMRIAPILLPHLTNPSADLWADAAIAGMITHNDAASNSACVAFTDILWHALSFDAPPEQGWWTRRYLEVAGPLEGSSRLKPRYGEWLDGYEGTLSGFVEMVVPEALRKGQAVREACDRWGSGAYLLETVPSVLYILERHASSPRDAIIRAVNDTKDNDTVAAIVGAVVGALHGKQALPPGWLDALLGRTAEDDDGYVFELIERARARYWSG